MNSKLENWKAGIDHFNSGRYWEAHEAWERDWLRLPREEKLHIQILIQVAGVFFLLEKGRSRGARSLLASATAKMDQLAMLGGVSQVYPRVEISDLEKGLSDLGQLLRSSDRMVTDVKFGRARLLLSPP
jgi:hypothetical protein